jgi:hypothetical protein
MSQIEFFAWEEISVPLFDIIETLRENGGRIKLSENGEVEEIEPKINGEYVGLIYSNKPRKMSPGGPGSRSKRGEASP